MNNTKWMIATIFGAAASSVVTWLITKNYYEKIIQEEINSVKEVFANRKTEAERKAEPKPVEDPEEPDEPKRPYISDEEGLVIEDPSMLKTEDDYPDEEWDEETMIEYFRFASEYNADVPSIEERASSKPKVIPPDDFGENHAYDQIELVYYADGILAEDRYIIENVDDIVGSDFAEHIGEYEDDSVYIRNDRLLSEYAIITDERSFYDVFKDMRPENDGDVMED